LPHPDIVVYIPQGLKETLPKFEKAPTNRGDKGVTPQRVILERAPKAKNPKKEKNSEKKKKG